MTGAETDPVSSEVTLLESKARVARGHLLSTIDALMNRRTQLVDSVERIKSAFHLLPMAALGVGAILALGVGVTALHDPSRRRNDSRERRPRPAKMLIVVGAALFIGLFTGFRAARHPD